MAREEAISLLYKSNERVFFSKRLPQYCWYLIVRCRDGFLPRHDGHFLLLLPYHACKLTFIIAQLRLQFAIQRQLLVLFRDLRHGIQHRHFELHV